MIGRMADESVRERRGRLVAASEGEEPLLTVIVPVYNEARTIDELLRRVMAAPYIKQVVVVDDGSMDGTAEVLQKWEGHAQIDFVRHVANRGKGAAVRTGLEHARGRFTIIQDGDLEYDPQEYALLVEPLLSGESEVVYGSRYLQRVDGSRWGKRVFRWGVGVLNVCTRCLYGARLTDVMTCYKAFPTSLLQAMDLRCERFEFCLEVTAKASRLGLNILEVPIRYDARTGPEGKKIGWVDELEALATLWKWRKWTPASAASWSRHGVEDALCR